MDAVAERELESYLAPFGLTAFRPGQREVIQTILSGQDCLCVMPTGGGKSLCYQLPAVARQGLTLVVSPLIALMKDQVDQLTALGLRASFINSTIAPDEQAARLDQMAAGYYQLMYVVPERFRSPRFLDALRRSNVNVLAIDEAHCISEWGHDFRPDYAKLGQFREQLGNPPTIALTATATAVVRRDIVELLHLREPKSFVTGFARPNLHYEVRSVSSNRDKDEALVAFLKHNPGSGIVYATSRKRCEEVAERIQQQTGRLTGVYHAGMESEARHAAQDAFMEGRTPIVVATTAFGMGVDKADVRFVVHYNLPGTIEGYYQEAGRAGRDGQPAQCLLLSTGGDRYIHEFFIESAYPAPHIVQQVYNFLRGIEQDPIELTLQDIKEQLALPIGSDGVGACEKMLEKAGAIERLEAVENMAAVRLNSDLPTLVDLLPAQAKIKRRVMRAVEAAVREQRHEWVYLHPRDLALRAELDPSAVARTLRELAELDSFDYIPPFRGRAIMMKDRSKRFADLDIDFETSERRKATEYEKLNLIVRYVQSRDCRQREILRYFGEAGSTPCGNCDNCAASGTGGSRWSSAGANNSGVTEAVRIVLSGVARARGRCGKQLLAQMLCGSAAKGVTRNRLDKLSTFGLLSHLTQIEVGELIEALVARQYIEQTEVDRFRPVLQLTAAGTEVMSGRAELHGNLPLPVSLISKLRSSRSKPSAGEAQSHAKRESKSSASHVDDEPSLDPVIVRRLRDWREQVSNDLKLPAYVVLTNATIEELARNVPRTREALLNVKGIGEAKAAQYGEALLELFARNRSDAAAVAPVSDADELEPNLLNEPNVAEAEATFDEAQAHSEEIEELAPEADAEMAALAQSAPASDGEVHPNHYWTWRLLAAGFKPAECMNIRNLDEEVILDHALRAMDSGWEVRAEWFLSPELIAQMDRVIGPATPARIRPLVDQFPPGTRYEHILLYLRTRAKT